MRAWAQPTRGFENADVASRTGVNTGEVIVGVNEDLAREYGIRIATR